MAAAGRGFDGVADATVLATGSSDDTGERMMTVEAATEGGWAEDGSGDDCWGRVCRGWRRACGWLSDRSAGQSPCRAAIKLACLSRACEPARARSRVSDSAFAVAAIIHVSRERKAHQFDCNPTLPVGRIFYHPYHSPVAASLLLFSTGDFGRQYHCQLD